MTEPHPYQCPGRQTINEGVRYWCMSFPGHSGRHFWDREPDGSEGGVNHVA